MKLQKADSPIRTHLLLLAICRGMVFWYAIEKLFELSIGISLGQIVFIGVIAQGSKVIFELPTSVIADRWSRRSILIAADIVMAACVITAGLASSAVVYAVGAVLWALSDALSSGVYEAFAYDSLAAQNMKSSFKKVYTRMRVAEWTTMALTGLAAGVVSHFLGLRSNFFLSLIPLVAGLYLLVKYMHEPSIERTSNHGITWFAHIGGTLQLMRSKHIRWPIALYISLFGMLTIWYEYFQLVGIDVHLPQWIFGSLIAVVTLGMALGAELAHRLKGGKLTLSILWISLIFAHLVGLRFSNAVLALVNLFIAFIAIQMLFIYLEVYIHEKVTSERRATIFSLAGTAAYAWFFLLAYVFTIALRHYGIRWAITIIALPMILLACIDILRGLPWSVNRAADELEAFE